MKYYKYVAFLLTITVYSLGNSLVWINLLLRQVKIAKVTRETVFHANHSSIPSVQKLSSSIKHEVNTYLLENPVLCTSYVNLTALIIVHSAPTHQDRRQTMRETWTNNSYYPNLGSVRVLFLLGAVKNMSFQAELEKEFSQHADILQGNFHNRCYNKLRKSTTKSLFGI
ncbi:uncharacterized protein LOC123524876 isoform X2 [Mercenaria mercenaria]|uniref:uncharacterized protein LOC123524876 isoform X2 n=1 Tax=Mercenaria mercenaria TaxID=6596 RepID=UPI00234F417E|nr:uncharacterized protein LOC123524876 isoform X2 [Mercenaria mercenaria]